MFRRRCLSSLGRSSGMFGWVPDKSSRCVFRRGHDGLHAGRDGTVFEHGIGELPWHEDGVESDDFEAAESDGLARVILRRM